jgi:hypothetical protein
MITCEDDKITNVKNMLLVHENNDRKGKFCCFQKILIILLIFTNLVTNLCLYKYFTSKITLIEQAKQQSSPICLVHHVDKLDFFAGVNKSDTERTCTNDFIKAFKKHFKNISFPVKYFSVSFKFLFLFRVRSYLFYFFK